MKSRDVGLRRTLPAAAAGCSSMLGAELQVQTDCSVSVRHCKASDDTLLAPEQARDVIL